MLVLLNQNANKAPMEVNDHPLTTKEFLPIRSMIACIISKCFTLCSLISYTTFTFVLGDNSLKISPTLILSAELANELSRKTARSGCA